MLPIPSHSIHGTGIFTYIYHRKYRNQPKVGKGTSHMDDMGIFTVFPFHLRAQN